MMHALSRAVRTRALAPLVLLLLVCSASPALAGPYGPTATTPMPDVLPKDLISFGPILGGAGLVDREGLGGVVSGGLALGVFQRHRPLGCFAITLDVRPGPSIAYDLWTELTAFGLGPMTFGGGFGVSFDSAHAGDLTGFVLGPEVVFHRRFEVGNWRPVLQLFARGEATVLGRDLVPDRAMLGARFLFDL